MLRRTTVENGTLEGIPASDPRITAFKGIPFAAPPVGELRWRPPQPAKDWQGIYKASAFASISMQATPGADKNDIYTREWHVDSDVPMSEDCLYLNVWTPAKNVNEKLPVMFWIFGGALQVGYPSEMEFDGERIARRGVVLVSVNYRVNLFGFFAHPEITAEQDGGTPGNFGLLDQMAGMEWVQRNIASFGGDPDNVTLFGQSAGAVSTMLHLTSPMTKGLFHKAIVHSGGGLLGPIGANLSLEAAEKNGIRFLEHLGVKTLGEARNLDAKYLLNKFISSQESFLFTTVSDGRFCPPDPAKVLMENKQHQVPLIVGNTGDEFHVIPDSTNVEEFEAFAREQFGKHADRYVDICKSGAKDLREMRENGRIRKNELGDMLWLEKNIRNEGPPIYLYNFDPEIPGWDNPGAFHSSELWFVFETLAKCWRPFVGKHYDLARQMCNYWTNFAKTGNPNGLDADGSTMPAWSPYTAESAHFMLFGDTAGMNKSDKSKLDKFILEFADDIIETLKFKR
jgi:para-nitrobenzyl esterase